MGRFGGYLEVRLVAGDMYEGMRAHQVREGVFVGEGRYYMREGVGQLDCVRRVLGLWLEECVMLGRGVRDAVVRVEVEGGIEWGVVIRGGQVEVVGLPLRRDVRGVNW